MQLAVLGIDLGKNKCSIVGLNSAGAVVQRRRLRREGVIEFTTKLKSCVVAMEACLALRPAGVTLPRISWPQFDPQSERRIAQKKPQPTLALRIDMMPWLLQGAGREPQSAVSLKSWILEPSATGLCEPDLHVPAKLFEHRLERGFEALALSGREIDGDDDVSLHAACAIGRLRRRGAAAGGVALPLRT